MLETKSDCWSLEEFLSSLVVKLSRRYLYLKHCAPWIRLSLEFGPLDLDLTIDFGLLLGR